MLIPLYLTSLVVVMVDGIAKMSLMLYNNNICIIYYMADDIAMWQMEWPQGLFTLI